MTSQAQTTPKPATHPMLAICGVLLGAMLATILGRLISVGSADLRAALHLDYDAAAWLGTAFNMGLVFIGPFSVYLGGLLGARRVLLASGALFTVIGIMLPMAAHLPVFIALLVAAGLTVGTFYPLTLSIVLRNLPPAYLLLGIAAYALDIVVTTHVAHTYEAWLMRSLSWRWIFWTDALLTPIMMLLIHHGVPRQPLPQPRPGEAPPSWRGFLYASLGASLLYAALDQGQRLDWWRSSLFVALTVTGAFLILAATARHFLRPNPLVHFGFLRQGNILLLGVVLVFFRFALLSGVVLVPSYLATAQGYTAEQTGPVLLWIALPQALAGFLAIALLARLDSRLILTAGFAIVACACICNAQLASTWSGGSFHTTQLLLALGEGFAFNGLVGTIVLELTNSGSMNNPIDALTFAGFFQTVRLMGGEAGSSFLQFFLQHREELHSNMLGQHLQAGATNTAQRTLALTASMLPSATTPDTATRRAAALLSLTVRQQAFTLAMADSFLLVALASTASLIAIACMSTLKLQYRQVTAPPPAPGNP